VKSSGRTLRAVAEVLGVGLSTLGQWVGAAREADLGEVQSQTATLGVDGLKTPKPTLKWRSNSE
jgi:transposase-like protein